MSEKTPHRRPATFKLDDPGVIVMDPDDSSRPARGTVQITPEADPAQLPVPIDTPLVPVRRGFRWGTLFWAATGGLVLLGLGLGIVNLIEDLFARGESLGFLGLAFAFAAALALTVVIAREAFGLARLATIEKLHLRATEVLLSDDRAASRSIVADLLKLAHQNPHLARARTALAGHGVGAIIRCRDPGRAGLLQLRFCARLHLLIAGLAADRIGAANQIPGRRNIIEEHGDDEGDTCDHGHLRPIDRRLDHPLRPTLTGEHCEVDRGGGEAGGP